MKLDIVNLDEENEYGDEEYGWRKGFSRIKALELAVEFGKEARLPMEIVLNYANGFERWLSNSQGWTLFNLRKKDLDFIKWFDEASSEQRDYLYGLVEVAKDTFPSS